MKKLTLLTLNLLLLVSANAASRYWVAASSSNWNNASNWSSTSGGAGGAGVPGSGDMAYFNSAANSNCSIDANANVAGFSISGYSGAITQGSGYTLTIGTSNFSQSSGTFNGGNSTIDINGSFGLTGGTFTSTSGTLYVATGWNHTTAGTFSHNAGTVSFDGAGGWYINLLSNNESFYNVIMDQSSGVFYFLNTNDKITVNGNITFSRGGISTWNNYAASIEVYGNVTVLSTFGTSWQNVVTLVFAGTASQNFDLTGATDIFNGKLQINKSSGSVTLVSNLTMDGSNQDLTLTSGTLNLNSYTLSNTTGICYCTGTFTISGSGTFSVYGWSQTSGSPILNISGSSNFTVGAANYTQSTGTITCNNAVIDINGNFNLSGGTFNATSGTMYLSGNWNHNTSGTFSHNSGTVTFDGSGNSQMFMISNLETFYNINIDKTGSGALVMITINDRALINGNLVLTRGAIYPNNSGEAKTLEVLGNVTVASTFVEAATVVTLKFSGTATQYFDLTGATALYNGKIEINKNGGSVILSSNLTMDGSNQDLLFTSGTLNLNSYSLVNSTGVTYCTGTFTVSGTGTLTNYAWSQTSGSAAFSISGASNFTINGNLSISTGTFSAGSATSFDVNGAFNLSGGTFTAPSGTMYLSGAWNHNTAGTFNHNNGTVCFDGSGTANMFMIGNLETFYSVNVNKTSGGYIAMISLNDRALINGNLTLTNGSIHPNNSGEAKILEVLGNVTVASTFIEAATAITLKFSGSATQYFDLTGATALFNGKIEIDKSGGSVILSSNLTMDASSQHLSFTSGTLNLNSYTLTNASGTTYCSGTFTVSGTGTLSNYAWSQSSGAAAFSISGASNFIINSNFTISTGTFSAGTATSFDINGAFNLSGGTFTAPSGTMYISGAWNHNTGGTFNHNNGTVCFDGTGIANMFMIGNLETFYSLTVNKTSGGYIAMISINDRALINGNLTLTNGSIHPNNSGEAKILEVLGNVTVASTFIEAATSITLKFSGSATQYFDLTGATALFNGKIEIDKSGGSVILSSNLTMDASGQHLSLTSGTLNLNSFTLTNSAGTTYCSGTFAVSGTGTLTNYAWSQTSGSAAFSITGASNFIINGNLSISTGTFSAGTATSFDINGAFNLSGGTFTAPSGTMYLSGAWNHNTGGTFNHNNGTVCFDGSGTANMFMIGNLETFYSVTVDKSSGGAIAMISINDKAIINGNLILTNGSIYPNNGGEVKTIEVLGDVTVSNTFSTLDPVITLNFTGSTSIQTFSFTGTTTRIQGNINVNKTSGKVNLASGVTVYSGKAFTVTAGTLNCLNQVISGPTFTLSSGATLELGSTGGIASSGASGNIQTTTRTFNSGAYYVYSGISGAQVTGTGLPSTIAGLTINNSSGVTLTATETINTLFTLSSGNLTLGDNNVVMASGSNISGGSNSSFIFTGGTGFLKFNSCAASSTKTFPVGHTNSTSGYVPLVITFNGGHTTDDFSVTAVDKVTNDGTRNGSAYTSTVVKAMWYITETNSGGSNVTMQFQWNGTDEASGFVRNSCFMSHYTNSAWEKPGSEGSASGSNPYTFTYSNYTGTFSPFGMGGSGGPLPVDLLYFKAENLNETAKLKWATASEINNDYFEIQKSIDGKNFNEIGRINGAGNSQQIIEYEFTDLDLEPGTNYYRLKQTDYNGEFSYSGIESILVRVADKFQLQLYPSPANDILFLDIKIPFNGENTIKIVDALGVTVLEKVFTISDGSARNTVDLSALSEGIYFIYVEDGNAFQGKRFIVKR